MGSSDFVIGVLLLDSRRQILNVLIGNRKHIGVATRSSLSDIKILSESGLNQGGLNAFS